MSKTLPNISLNSVLKHRKENSMTDKEKIIAYIDKLLEKYPKNYHLLMVAEFIDTMQKEPVSEDLQEACDSYYDETWDDHGGRGMVVDDCYDIWFPSHATDDFFKAGAKWQKERFEKNRLAHCDAQTEEEAEIESDFVMGIIENEHRQPTFDDAIKYGMRLQHENMIKGAISLKVKETFGKGDEVAWVIKPSKILDKKFNVGEKVKLIVIKED